MANPGDVHNDPPLMIDDRQEEPATDLVFDRPTDYRCSFEGCGYIMIDAAAGDIEDHYGDHFEREALPAPLDVERLIEAEKNTPGPAFPMSEFLPRLAAEYARLPSTEPAQGGER